MWTAMERLKTIAHIEMRQMTEVVRIADGPGGVAGAIGTPKHKVIVGDGLVVEGGE